MSEPIQLTRLDLVSLFPTLLHKDGYLLKPPSTVIQLRAANQYLRAQPDFETSVGDSSMSVRRGELSGVLTCSVYGHDAHSFGWGSTVEGVTPEQDIVEPHLVLNPHNDGILLHYESPPNLLTPDVAVLGFVEGEGGIAIPLMGTENELGAVILKGGSGNIRLFKEGKTYAISVAPELTSEGGQPAYMSADDPLNLTVGGIHLVFIRGKATEKVEFSFSDFLRDDRRGSFDAQRFGLGNTMKSPSPSAAAHAGYGEKQGESKTVSFSADLSTAIPAFVRLRVDKTMPPLKGTVEWTAWMHSQSEIRKRYNAIVCNSCGRQAGSNEATMESGLLNIHAGCGGCGAHSFGVVEGYVRKEK